MVKGVAAFQRRFRAIPGKVRAEVVKTLEKEAENVCNVMRALVPVQSGDLRASIGWTWGDAPKGAITVGQVSGRSYDRIAITIYAGGEAAFYARFQEFGTVRAPANPFFFPAWRAERSRVRGNITRAVRRGFQKS